MALIGLGIDLVDVEEAERQLDDARGVRWRNIEVVRRQDGLPSVRLHGDAARLTQRAGVVRISLSLSHARRTAGAVALIEQD